MIGVLILGLVQTLMNFKGTLSAWSTRIAVGLIVLPFIPLHNAITTAARRRSRR